MGFAIAKSGPLFESLARRSGGLTDQAIIRRICDRLIRDAEAKPPVSVEVLASLRGIVEIEEIEQPFAGMLAPTGRHFIVTVCLNDGYERQRFTVCHEIGHTFFTGFAERQWRCNGARSLLERRCDLAASELLLPFRFFDEDLTLSGLNLDATEELATKYEASIEATARRSVDLWSRPALMLAFSERHKPSQRGLEGQCEPKLRLDYAYKNGAWPFIRRYKSVTLDSVFGRAFNGELVDEMALLGDLCGEVGPVQVSARRYGGRVLALVRHARRAIT